MRSRTPAVHLTLIACIALAGCATNRSEVKLTSSAPAAAAPVSGKPIVIRTVTDARVFEEKPRDPSVPSIGFEGSALASADVRSRAIGRKRNTYGMALGDVVLEPGDSVEKRIRHELQSALHEAGYRVVTTQPEAASAPAIDVRIVRFWSWVTPGLFTITLGTTIATQLSLGGAAPIEIDVRGADPLLAATDGAWIESVEKALARYRAAVIERKAQLP